MTGLARFPSYASGRYLYRGIDSQGAELARKEYHGGRVCHWSGFSSTTPTICVAQSFAKADGSDGLILRIKILKQSSRSRDIRSLSAIQNEDEVLLLPNFCMLVVE